MKDASEDEQEEDFILPATKTTSSSNRPKKDVTADRAVKAQREEQLRQMMDVDGLFIIFPIRYIFLSFVPG